MVSGNDENWWMIAPLKPRINRVFKYGYDKYFTNCIIENMPARLCKWAKRDKSKKPF
jgi:hypothetical protein